MIYFIYQGSFCSAEEINEQMAKRVQYITEEEYTNYLLQQGLEQEEQENE